MKLFLSGIIALTFTTNVLAQGTSLFPELQGQFSIPSTQKKEETSKMIENAVIDSSVINNETEPEKTEVKKRRFRRSQPTEELTQEQIISADPFAIQNQLENATGPSAEGNIKIQLTNLKGVLPYARDYAYCFGDLVLTNGTNQKLESLSVKLTYRDTPTIVSFSGVDKKKTQKQSLMLIGRACEDILSTPEIEVQECKMPPQSEESCKKRVQFIPPNG